MSDTGRRTLLQSSCIQTPSVLSLIKRSRTGMSMLWDVPVLCSGVLVPILPQYQCTRPGSQVLQDALPAGSEAK